MSTSLAGPLTLYAFTEKVGHSELQDISARIGNLDGPAGIDLVEGEFLSALIGPTSRYRRLRSLEYNRFTRLQHQQVVLEAAMEETRVLPASFGTTLPTRKDVLGLLSSHGKRLQALMERYGNLVELEIVVAWNITEVVRSILTSDGLEIPNGSRTNRSMARALEAAIEDKRRSLKSNIEDAIDVVCMDSRAVDTADESTLLRRVVLLSKNQEDRLFSLLRQINKCGGGKISIKCIGPLPPCRFASVRVWPSRPDGHEKDRSSLHIDTAESKDGPVKFRNRGDAEAEGTDTKTTSTRSVRKLRHSPLELLTRIANGKSLTHGTVNAAIEGQDRIAPLAPVSLGHTYLISIDRQGPISLHGTSLAR